VSAQPLKPPNLFLGRPVLFKDKTLLEAEISLKALGAVFNRD
jgi:hypothetical protein